MPSATSCLLALAHGAVAAVAAIVRAPLAIHRTPRHHERVAALASHGSRVVPIGHYLFSSLILTYTPPPLLKSGASGCPRPAALIRDGGQPAAHWSHGQGFAFLECRWQRVCQGGGPGAGQVRVALGHGAARARCPHTRAMLAQPIGGRTLANKMLGWFVAVVAVS